MELQRTEEWFKDRLGCITASRVADVMSKSKSGVSKTRQSYMSQLICERLTGSKVDNYINSSMQRGIELESKAREVYLLNNFDYTVTETGFIRHPTIKWFGASPDGLVGNDGLVEIKCPNSNTHLEFLETRKPKREYILQMQTQMLCTGREWCDFVSYDDRYPTNLAFSSVRVYTCTALALEIENSALEFLRELEARMDKLLSEVQIENNLLGK